MVELLHSKQLKLLSSVNSIEIECTDEKIPLVCNDCAVKLYYFRKGGGVLSVDGLATEDIRKHIIAINRNASDAAFFLPSEATEIMIISIQSNGRFQIFPSDGSSMDFCMQEDRQLYWLMDEIYTECISDLPLKEELLDVNAYKLVLLLARRDIPYADFKAAESRENTAVFQEIKLYLEENYAESITLEKLARKYHMSSSHLSHRYKEIYGIAPINYLLNVRIAHAIMMLNSTDLSVKEISMQVGYENEMYFSSLFKRFTQESPTNYRIKMRRNI